LLKLRDIISENIIKGFSVRNQSKKLITLLFFIFSFSSVVLGQGYNNADNQVKAKKLDINTLFQQDDYRNVSLSPDGKHIALIGDQKGTPVLIIVAVDTMKAINQISFANKDSVGSYSWANNERLLVILDSKQRNKERKGYYGEIYSINIDEVKGKFIFGFRSLVRRGRIKQGTKDHDYEKHLAHPKIISMLKKDPEHIIISTSQYNDEGMWVYKLNIYDGQIETLAKIDDSKANYKTTRLSYFDTLQQLWLRSKHVGEDTTIARYDFDDNAWIEYQPINASQKLKIISSYKDTKQLVVKDYCGNDTLSVCLFNPKNQQLSSLYQVDNYDINWLYLDNKDTPFAVSYFNEYPQYKILDKSNPMAQKLSEFLAKFTGYDIGVDWGGTDKKRALISVSSDIQPTLWYLFDGETNKMSYVAHSKKGIDSNLLHPQYSFKFNARDNTPIQGYITLPTKNTNEAVPAVILVHGGPHSRDYWGFDPEVQLLSSRGYAVVQVNFRGSGGFGFKFEEAGFEQWGKKIQFDILDSINYLVEKQYIDKDRLCIMGASFGGYSAIQSSIIAPDLFKCTVARSGIYDLQLLLEDKESTPEVAQDLITRVGAENFQNAHSPIKAIHMLKAPVLLVHGTKDDRTPLEQAEVLIEQLEKHKKAYEWFEMENEGHSFYKAKNRMIYHEKVMQFLNKYNPITL
jgi:dipeptidyl aminopeptidase/acylaminoacyl peptidase